MVGVRQDLSHASVFLVGVTINLDSMIKRQPSFEALNTETTDERIPARKTHPFVRCCAHNKDEIEIYGCTKAQIIKPEVLRQHRKSRRENQAVFWAKFGVTQSRGSRFETGEAIPKPIEILLMLYLSGKITDNDLGNHPITR